MKSDRFKYQNGVNETLRDLQRHLVASLNKASAPTAETQFFSIHAVVGKGDWAWRREWLQQGRHYSNITRPGAPGAGICPRCLAGTARCPEWLDIEEKFNHPSILQEALPTAVGEELPMKQLKGWTVGSEYADCLHAVWLGVGRDLLGSLCLDLVAADPKYAIVDTWDDRLRILLHEIQDWCREHGIRPSTLEELSCQA